MILTYHKVFPENLTHWWVSVDDFYRQMCEISYKKVVYLDEYDPHNPKHLVITFDGVYSNVAKYAAPILKKFNYPFELFIIGERLGKGNSFDISEPFARFANAEELKRMLKMGGRLQYHSWSHPDFEKIKTKKAIEKELTIPKELRKLDRGGFNWFAFPYGKFSKESIKLVKKYYKGAVTSIQGNDTDMYKLNRIEVASSTSFKKASIAVIIASYNYGNFLVEAIESVLRQTRLPDEILITDDCSSDNTQEIALDYVKRYPGLIRYNRNKKNLGIVKHFAKAVNKTHSDYIAFLGADNRFRSDYIEKTSMILDKNENVGIAYTDFALFGKRAPVIYGDFPKAWQGRILEGVYYIINFPNFSEKSKNLLKIRNFIHGSSMYKRKAYKDAGGYLNQSKYPEDHSLFLRIVKSGWGAVRVPEPVLEYRQHAKEQANIKYANAAMLNFYRSEYKRLGLEISHLRQELEKIKSSKTWKLLYLYKDPKNATLHYIKKICQKFQILFSKIVG